MSQIFQQPASAETGEPIGQRAPSASLLSQLGYSASRRSGMGCFYAGLSSSDSPDSSGLPDTTNPGSGPPPPPSDRGYPTYR